MIEQIIIKTENGYIFNLDDVLSIADIALKSKDIELNQRGYFANNLADLKTRIEKGNPRKLIKICKYAKSSEPFINDQEFGFPFFLPADKVIIPKPKYRPFNNDVEFKRTLGILDTGMVTFRSKDVPHIISCLSYQGYRYNINTNCIMFSFGNAWYDPKELLNDYEWKDSDKWRPFGIKEN